MLNYRRLWCTSQTCPLLCLVPLFLVMSVLAACERKPLPERQVSESKGPNTARAEPGASSIPSVHVLVDASEAMLFGAIMDGRWLPAESAAPLTRKGMKYGLYTLTRRLGESRGGEATPPSKACSNPRVDIADVPQTDADVIAVGGNWHALPRTPSVHSTQQWVYRDLVAKWLRAKGIADPVVNITQILRVDLEGDKTDEVLIAANLLRGDVASAKAGDYSVVLLRKIMKGEVQSIPVVEEYYFTGCIGECAPAAHRVAALLDVNGDGVMEIVLAWRGYKGRGKTVYQVEGGDVRNVLSWACGP
jgi:hypothetical protein